MADMLRGTCSRGCCGRGVYGANPRPADKREWQRDVEAGHYSAPDYDWGCADEDWLNAAGNYAAYLSQPTEARDPYAPYGQPHCRPLEREDHERGEAHRRRMAERVKRIREDRAREP